ncbi:YadA-like family protein [Taylorella equigenitalis]|uniref:YadA-like family protein n=1 Tax=Taylorella equigenitalis TaxID=29575 RepID=UPI00237C950C|nr:YadA-like family protein [Taylorella equigenitalis]WDU54615.1 YadA-like family protein [Taylorella equigenitalis]
MKSFKFKTTFVLTLLAISPQITQAHIMGTNLANPLGRWKDKSNEATPIFYNCTPEDVSTKRKKPNFTSCHRAIVYEVAEGGHQNALTDSVIVFEKLNTTTLAADGTSNDNSSNIQALTEKVDTHEDKIAKLISNIETNSNSIDEFKKQIKIANKSAGEIDSIKNKVDGISTSIKEIGKNLKESKTAVSKIDTKVEKNKDAIKGVNFEIDKNKEKISGIKGELAKNTTAVEKIGAKVDKAVSDVKGLGVKVATNTRALKATDLKVEKNTQAISANKILSENNKKGIDANKKAIAINRSDIAKNKEGISSNKASIDATSDKLGELIESLKSPTFEQKVTANGGLTVSKEFKVSSSSEVSMGGNRVKDLADAVDNTDAVNLGQLKAESDRIYSTLDKRLKESNKILGEELDNLKKQSRAGTASAMAIASLPQAWTPDQVGLGLGVATYRGGFGYAVGVSAMSGDEAWVGKASISGDSKGGFGGSLGMMFSF